MIKTFILRDEVVAQQLWAVLRANWQAMAAAGTPLAVSIKPHKSKRTLDQNAMLHAMLGQIADQAWAGGRQYPLETWKELVRRRFVGTEEIDMPDGTRIDRGVSTTTLNVEQMSWLIERVMHWSATELGVQIGGAA